MIRRLLLLFLMFTMVVNASAQALPVSRIGAEVAAVVKSKIASRGFAANDPRFGGTVSAVGSVVIQLATAVVVGGTAPAWGSLLATALIAGAVGYGIQALANWLFNSDGTVTYTPPSTGGAPQPNQRWVWITFHSGEVKGYPLVDPDMNTPGAFGSAEVCHAFFDSQVAFYVFYGVSQYGCWVKLGQVWGDRAGETVHWTFSSMMAYVSSDPDPNYKPPGSGSTQPVTKPAAEALQALSEAEKAKPLPAKVIADLADAAFRQAASQPGYDGVPYALSDPITEADVAAFRAANPTFEVATIGDLAAPISGSDPLGQGANAPSTGTPVNPAASSPLLNLGSDPGIGTPNLEATPTGMQILQPLRQLMPDLRNFQVPSHQAVCPKPTFELFGKAVVMDGQCTILEGVRGELYNAMVLAFVLVALLIVLSA